MLKQALFFSLTLFILSSCGWLGNFKIKGNSSINTLSGNPGETSNLSTTSVASPNGLQLSSPQPAVADRCWPLTVVSTYNGVASPVTSNTTVNLSLPSGVTAYSTSNCATGSETTTATIPSGSSSTVVWVKTPVPGNYLIGSSGPNLPPTTVILTVNQNNDNSIPVRIGLTGPNSTAVDNCVSYTASFYGTDNNFAVFNKSSTMSLSSSDVGLAFYSTAGCSGNSVSAITFPSNTPTVSFFFKTQTTGLKSIFASTNNLLGNAIVLVQPQDAARSRIQGPAVLNGNQCGTFTVNLVDSLNNLVSAQNDTEVNLSRSGEGTFYSSASCTSGSEITKTTIPRSSSGAFFYYKGTIASTNTVTSKVTGLQDGTFTFNVIAPSASGPARLGFDPMVSQTSAGNCLGPVRVQIQDTNGIVLTSVSSTAIALSQTGNGKFFSDSSCRNSITTSMTNTDLYFQDTRAENIVLYATDPSAHLSDASKNLLITAGAKFQLVALGSFAPFVAGSCQPIDIFYADPYFNAVVSSSDTNVSLQEVYPTSGKFFSNMCTTQLPSTAGVYQAVILANSPKVTVYFQETIAGLGRLKAFDGVVRDGIFDFQVGAGAAKKIALENSPSSGGTNSCVGPLKFILLDDYNNKTVASSAINFTLNTNLGTFYQAGCSTSPANWQIPKDADSVSAYFMSPTAGLASASATPAANPPSGLNFTLNIDGTSSASQVAVIGKSPLSTRGPANTMIGLCLPFALRTESPQGTASLLSSAQTFTVKSTSPASLDFYQNSTCTTPLSQPVSTNGTETLFYVKPKAATSLSLFATGGGLASLLYDLDIAPGALSSLEILGNHSTQVGVCETFTIRGKDSLGNVTAIPSGTSFSVSGAGQGLIYAQPGCSDVGSSAKSVSVTSPAINAAFYYRSTKPETVTLTSSASVGTPPSITLTISAGAPAFIVLEGPTSTAVNTCSGNLQFKMLDAYNNPLTMNPTQMFSIAATGTVGLYDEACTSSKSQVQIVAGQILSEKFRFKATTGQTSNLTIAGLSANVLGYSLPIVLTVTAPPVAQFVLPLNPNSAPNTGGTLVTINGSNFSPTGSSPTVLLGSVACTVTSFTNTQIICRTGSSPAGLVSLSVTTPSGTGTAANAFTYTDCNSIPSDNSISGTIYAAYTSSSQYEFTHAGYRHEYLRTVKGVPFDEWYNYWYSLPKEGISYLNDATTMKKACQMMGYHEVNQYIQTGSWSSPGDNATVKWDAALKKFKMQRGSDNNSWVWQFNCRKKLPQTCYDNPMWLVQ